MINDKYAHRKGTASVVIPGGENRQVAVRQVKSRFLFGCSEFSVAPYLNNEMDTAAAEKAEKRYGHLFDIFNAVTLPFYWGGFERERGKPNTESIHKAARWLKDKGVTLKGHPLCWHTVCAPWLLEMTNKEIFETQLARVRREMTDFKGLVGLWDVINEAVIMPVFDRYDNGVTRICRERGRIGLIRELFAAAREADDSAVLLVNDFDTSKAYDILLEGLLESGVKIDAIGIQSHMHQGCWSTEKLREILARFSRFKLPLHFTEVTLVSGEIMPPHIVDLNDFKPEDWPSTEEGEIRQAREAAMFYEELYANPYVESVTWWSFHDGLWLNAPSGLLDRNSDPKPVYHELRKRIRGAWWTGEQTLTADGEGRIAVTGFKGDYAAVCEGRETGFKI